MEYKCLLKQETYASEWQYLHWGCCLTFGPMIASFQFEGSLCIEVSIIDIYFRVFNVELTYQLLIVLKTSFLSCGPCDLTIGPCGRTIDHVLCNKMFLFIDLYFVVLDFKTL